MIQAKVFFIAETTLRDEFEAMLRYVGAPDWHTDSHTGGETLIEAAGRLCYKSFAPGLNPNVTKVREGNKAYIGNLLNQKHGSVLEHTYATFALMNVSRILTHELVRHRHSSPSQESQRFVRLDEFEMYVPDLTDALYELAPPGTSAPLWVNDMQKEYLAVTTRIKDAAKFELASLISALGLDKEGTPFHVKKKITSALRRFLPGGVNTNIFVTANLRSWRHMIEVRTSEGAEDEIREVFDVIAHRLSERFTSVFQDASRAAGPGLNSLGTWKFEHSKV